MTTKAEPTSSCCDDFDPNSLAVDAALARIESDIHPVEEKEQIAIRAALGRVLAEEIESPINVPSHTNSAMDGYAISAEDLPETGVSSLQMIGTAWAGRPFAGEVKPGECVRIMTGAPLAKGTDTIIMQEDVKRVVEGDGDRITIGSGHRPKQHVRYAGEDIARGQVALQAGYRMTPANLGLAASLGLGEIKVFRKPRIAFFSTGDELRGVGETLGEGEVYDSNRYTLFGMLQNLGVDFLDLGVVRDDKDALRQTLIQAAKTSDAVITSAGVSVGEADFIKEILDEIGEVNFWKIAMKPGRPLAFGKIDNALFFGLPGNPVSVMVTFYQFVLPGLKRLMGQRHTAPVRLKVRCASTLKKRPGRMEFQRGLLETGENGEITVRSTGDQGSGILSSMAHADCFIVLPPESDRVEAGAIVEIEPFHGLI